MTHAQILDYTIRLTPSSPRTPLQQAITHVHPVADAMKLTVCAPPYYESTRWHSLMYSFHNQDFFTKKIA